MSAHILCEPFSKQTTTKNIKKQWEIGLSIRNPPLLSLHTNTPFSIVTGNEHKKTLLVNPAWHLCTHKT